MRADELSASEENSKLKEEQLKRKAERKRAKKKRQNERKKQQKNSSDHSMKSGEGGSSEAAAATAATAAESSYSIDSGSDDPAGVERLELDLLSAFVSKTAGHKNSVLPGSYASASGEACRKEREEDVPTSDVSYDKKCCLPFVIEQQPTHPLGLLPPTVVDQRSHSQRMPTEMKKLSARTASTSAACTAVSASAMAADSRSATALSTDPVATLSLGDLASASSPSPVLLSKVFSSSDSSSDCRPPSASVSPGSLAAVSAASSMFVPSAVSSAAGLLALDLGSSRAADISDTVHTAATEEDMQLQAIESCLELGRLGNSHALDGHFIEAIAYYSEGIQRDPCDYRFWGNRSLCRERLMMFEEALKDADASIRICESYAKGHFRRGVALVGLKRIGDAEQAFERALALDPSDIDTQQNLAAIRTALLVEMGFAELEAWQKLASHAGSLQRALEALLSQRGPGHEHVAAAGRAVAATTAAAADEDFIAVSDVDGQSIECMTTHNADQLRHINTAKSSVGSGYGTGSSSSLTGLWIGNIKDPIDQDKLFQLCSSYGGVASIVVLPHKYCAIANFYLRSGAEKAMEGLQGHVVGRNRLLIRFADKN